MHVGVEFGGGRLHFECLWVRFENFAQLLHDYASRSAHACTSIPTDERAHIKPRTCRHSKKKSQGGDLPSIVRNTSTRAYYTYTPTHTANVHTTRTYAHSRSARACLRTPLHTNKSHISFVCWRFGTRSSATKPLLIPTEGQTGVPVPIPAILAPAPVLAPARAPGAAPALTTTPQKMQFLPQLS